MIASRQEQPDRGEDGRRIYIHERTLDWLALSSPIAAQRVIGLQQSAQARKILHHRVEQAVELGVFRSALARAVSDRVDDLTIGSFTSLLRSIGFRPPERREAFETVLGDDEEVAATCFEDGYYTFATDGASARRMYADHEPLKQLRNRIRSGIGPCDLTIIKGRALAFVIDSIEPGPTAGPAYERAIRAERLSAAELQDARECSATELVLHLKRELLRGLDYERDEEMLVCQALGAMDRCMRVNKKTCNALTRGALPALSETA